MLRDRITSPLRWGRGTHLRAVENARGATTALSRSRVEREEVALFLAERYAVPATGSRPA